MDAIKNILERRSVRNFTKQEISEEDLKTILAAGMAGPSCVNARDFSFIVSRNPEILQKMYEANGKPATPLLQAKLAILVLGDLERAFKHAPDYWVIDGAIAAQNMTLAASALGIGSVWLGTYPQMDRVNNLVELFELPDTVIPHSIIAFGYPIEEEKELTSKGFYEESRVHYDKW